MAWMSINCNNGPQTDLWTDAGIWWAEWQLLSALLLPPPVRPHHSNSHWASPSQSHLNTSTNTSALWQTSNTAAVDEAFKGDIWCNLRFCFLFGVCCIDKMPEVAKTKVSNPKTYSLSKLRRVYAFLNASFKHAPTCLHHGVGRFA